MNSLRKEQALGLFFVTMLNVFFQARVWAGRVCETNCWAGRMGYMGVAR